jgi:hypothetical protein
MSLDEWQILDINHDENMVVLVSPSVTIVVRSLEETNSIH